MIILTNSDRRDCFTLKDHLLDLTYQALLFVIEHALVGCAGIFVKTLKLTDPQLIKSHQQELKLVEIGDGESVPLNIPLNLLDGVAVRVGQISCSLTVHMAPVLFLYLSDCPEKH